MYVRIHILYMYIVHAMCVCAVSFFLFSFFPRLFITFLTPFFVFSSFFPFFFCMIFFSTFLLSYFFLLLFNFFLSLKAAIVHALLQSIDTEEMTLSLKLEALGEVHQFLST